MLLIVLCVLKYTSQTTLKTHRYPNYDSPSGYNYYPLIPPHLDEQTSPHPPGGLYDLPHEDLSPTYLPPPIYPPLGSVPQFDPLPTDETPLYPPSNQYLPPAPPPSTQYGVPNVQFKVINMSCLDTTTSRFFRSAIRSSQPLDSPPIIDNSKKDCIFGTGDTFIIDLNGNDMTQCGVRYCSSPDQLNICVSLRHPTVRGVRLPEDPLITLQCRPQERIASHTKQFRILPQIV